MAGRKIALAVIAIALGSSTASANMHDRPGFGYTGSGAPHSHYQQCHDAQGHFTNGGGPCDPEKEKKANKNK